MRTAQFARSEDGQALVIVAIAMVALMGALALTLDWGHGYVQRRGMQNMVDNATLAAGRHVASSFAFVSGAPAFVATLEEVCDDVAARTAGLPGPAEIAFFSDPGDPATWTRIETDDCADGAGVSVPEDTIFVRVRAANTYRSLTQQTITIAAAARARLTGSAGCANADCAGLRPLELPSTTPPPSAPREGVSGYTTAPNIAIWPLALHLNLSDFRDAPCGQYCDASNPANRTDVWPADRYGPSGQQFTGLLTYTHFSPRENDDGSSSIHQFTTESDYTGTTDDSIRDAHAHNDNAVYPHAEMPNADLSACGGAAAWDTLGMVRLVDAATCDLPNWFAYGFRGSIGLNTDWSGSFNGLPGNGVDRPEALAPGRDSCDRSVYLPRPSCTGTANQIGDWIETVPGDLTSLMAEQMRDFVTKYGRVVPNSSTPVSSSPGAPLLGKAVVVYIPLWDCAEHFDRTENGNDRWQLIVKDRGGDPDELDCSKLKKVRGNTVDRVHIAAVVPFTFYENLIKTSPVSVQAYWGNAFGDAGICREDPLAAGCALNQFINSAFLVPDE